MMVLACIRVLGEAHTWQSVDALEDFVQGVFCHGRSREQGEDVWDRMVNNIWGLRGVD
jgi:hypothetical protein